jgi:ring-1,2-phenylacetyl-CoA epoxidase subunit PaaE
MSNESSIYRTYTVTTVIDETEDARSFELKPTDKDAANYEAGQFITIVFARGDREERRSYSFSSAPSLDEPMRITVKRIPNGEYSRWLFKHLKPGDIITSSGISGFFKLPADTGQYNKFVFLAAGSGITPVFSLLKTVLHTTDLPVVLIYSNTAKEDTIFYKEIQALQTRSGKRLTVTFLFSQADHGRRRLSQFLLHSLLKEHDIPLRETLFYLCGPVSYMLVASISLITAGVPGQHIRKENFNTRPHTFKPLPPDTDAHMVKVFVADRSHTFVARYPDTILSAAKKRQIRLPYSCEAGNCGSCTATCVSGEVWMAYNEVLTDDEIRNGKVLTCQAYPVGGDVILQF